jgi:hypothetical protein
MADRSCRLYSFLGSYDDTWTVPVPHLPAVSTSSYGSGAFTPADGSIQQVGQQSLSTPVASTTHGQYHLPPPISQNWSNATYPASQGTCSNPPWGGSPQPSMNPIGDQGSFGGSQLLPQSSPYPEPSQPVNSPGKLAQALGTLGLGKKENDFGYTHVNTGSDTYTGTAPPASYQDALDQKNQMTGISTGFPSGCHPQTVGVIPSYQNYPGVQSPPSMSQPYGFGNDYAPGPEPPQYLYPGSNNPYQTY